MAAPERGEVGGAALLATARAPRPRSSRTPGRGRRPRRAPSGPSLDLGHTKATGSRSASNAAPHAGHSSPTSELGERVGVGQRCLDALDESSGASSAPLHSGPSRRQHSARRAAAASVRPATVGKVAARSARATALATSPAAVKSASSPAAAWRFRSSSRSASPSSANSASAAQPGHVATASSAGPRSAAWKPSVAA